MKSKSVTIAFLTVLFCIASIASADPQPGTQNEKTINLVVDGKKVTVGMHLYIPKEYNELQKVPLLLFLHGSGERGKDLDLVLKWGPPKHINAGKDFPMIVVSPQCPSEERWDAATLAELVKWMLQKYKIDRDRLYVTGLSMGGEGTYALIESYPKLFAAAVPICGAIEPNMPKKFKSVPIQSFVGSEDKVLKRMMTLTNAITSAGGKARLYIHNGVGHVSWPLVYEDDAYIKWLLMHKRISK